VAKTGPAALSEETNPLRKLRRMQEAGCACLCARGRGSVFVFVFVFRSTLLLPLAYSW
jgi:hypothetical protein